MNNINSSVIMLYIVTFLFFCISGKRAAFNLRLFFDKIKSIEKKIIVAVLKLIHLLVTQYSANCIKFWSQSLKSYIFYNSLTVEHFFSNIISPPIEA